MASDDETDVPDQEDIEALMDLLAALKRRRGLHAQARGSTAAEGSAGLGESPGSGAPAAGERNVRNGRTSHPRDALVSAEAHAKSQIDLDATDRAILHALLVDGRASHRDIAETTGTSLATVNRRIHQLEDNGVIQGYTVRIDPEVIGWNLTAIIGLRIEKGFLRTVQEDMAEDPRIFGVYDITGEWDGIVLARLRDRADLDDLTKTTLSHDHVTRTNTMVVLKTVLEDLRVPVI